MKKFLKDAYEKGKVAGKWNRNFDIDSMDDPQENPFIINTKEYFMWEAGATKDTHKDSLQLNQKEEK